MSDFYAYLNRMKYIKRWSLMNNVSEENVMEHSQAVAVIAHALALIGNKYFGKSYDANLVGMAAQFHETSEVITGDLPTPIKYYNREINHAYKDLEHLASEKLIAMLPKELQDDLRALILPLDEDVKRLVKAADKLSALVKCVEELKSGNREFAKAKEAIEKDLKAFNMPEVNYFIDNFAAAYAKTLDELE